MTVTIFSSIISVWMNIWESFKILVLFLGVDTARISLEQKPVLASLNNLLWEPEVQQQSFKVSGVFTGGAGGGSLLEGSLLNKSSTPHEL